MTIIIDSRADKSRDMLKSFGTLNGHEGSRPYYPPNTPSKTDFFGKYMGLPRRFFYGPHPITKKGAWWAFQPKVSQTAQRSEGAFIYEPAINARTFYWKVHHTSTGNMKYIPDTTGYQSIIGQWHEQWQPNGSRPPPFEVSVYYDKVAKVSKLRATIGHDGGTGNSGTSIAPTLIEFPLGDFVLDQDIEFCVKIKAEGTLTDYFQMWVNGVQKANYTGYVGYPSYDGNGVYNQQNFFKIGTYYYQQHGSPTYRAVCQLGLLIGDSSETLTSMRAAWDAPVAVTPHTRKRVAVAVIGGVVAGFYNQGAVNRALYGRPCIDPVEPAVSNWATMVPAISSRLAERNMSAVVYNCGLKGIGMTSLSGRCRGTWAANTVYVPGDIITPSSVFPVYDPTGNPNNRLENGLCLVCEVGGTSAATEPGWSSAFPQIGSNSTVENQAVTDGTVTWRTERRETYHTPGKIFQFGELGFDPLGLVSQAMMCVDQTVAADRKILLLMPGLDPAANSVPADTAAAIASITAHANTMGIEVMVSNQTVNGTIDDALLGQIGRAAANEIV